MQPIKRVVIMIDSETLGLRSNCVATQLAFVAVDADDPTSVIREASEYLPIQPQLSLGRKIDADTMLFWMRQPDATRDKLQMSSGNDMDELMACVTSIAKKLRETIESADDYEVFCRGLDFDIPIFESLFDMAGIEESPWRYDKKYDLRTTMLEAGVTKKDVERAPGLIEHDAMHDCKYQLQCLFEARRKMRAQV